MKNNIIKKEKVLIALSGGIDSAVSAYLLIKQGYSVEAAFMKNWSSTEGLKYNECPWLADRQDALRVAAFLRIPLHTLDFEKQYGDNVLKYFFKEYQAGRTPNPDVMCNKEIKFKLLYDWAMSHGFDYLATGHYAQIRKVAISYQQSAKSYKLKPKTYNLLATSYKLIRSADEFKDQTYFIYNIKTGQLPHILFPVGGMKKDKVKALADKIGLPNSGKKESMGLCFVGKIRLQDFLDQKLKPKAGSIVDQFGKTIGQHNGLYYYTIGQRQGIKVGSTGPYYVVRKDLSANTLYVTNNPDDPALLTKEVQIHSVNWISGLESRSKNNEVRKTNNLHITSYKLVGRFRHQGELVPLTIQKLDSDHYQVIFNKPQKAIASGQSLVFYRGKECVGGGVIA